MSDMTQDKADELRARFDPAAVGKLPKGGGILLDYVGHAAVTDRLLKVDREWKWEPMGIDEYGLPALDKAGNLWIKLTILGVTRIGVGDGPSAKIAIGDAIRNAAMRFGVALDLWSKEELHSEPAKPQPAEGEERVQTLEDGSQKLWRYTGGKWLVIADRDAAHE